MSRRYSFTTDPSERTPLDYQSSHSNPHAYSPPPPPPPPPPPHSSSLRQKQQQKHHYFSSSSSSPRRQHQLPPEPEPEPELETETFYRDHPAASDPRSRPHPGAHPDSAFDRLRQNRRQQGRSPDRSAAAVGAGIGGGAVAGGTHALAASSPSRPSNITPGADNFSEAASGGIPGLAMSVAERNARQSGLDAMRGSQQQQQQQQQPYYSPPAYQQSQAPPQPPYDDHQPYGYGHDQGYDASQHYNNSYDRVSASSHLTPSAASATSGAAAAGVAMSIGSGTPRRSVHSYASDPFRDPRMDFGMGQFNPNDIDDDGDEGLDYRRSARTSMLSLGNSSHRGNGGTAGAAAAAGGAAAAAGGVMGGLMGRNRNSAANYDPVQNTAGSYQLGGPGENGLAARAEKSEWITKQDSSRKKWKWFLGISIGLLVAGGIAGGVVGGLLGSKNQGSGGSSGQSASDDTAANGDLDINSSEIKALMNNPDLHKVFPGVDYTPINVQFPECLENPPSQNNVTRDVAVLSQLTNTIRLYGTDCNQTEMTIHALDRLQLQDEVKIWLGVWQDGNDTTNRRQLSKMWNILDQYGDKPFKGLIVGNEILFREEMTAQQLGNLLDTVRSNLSDHGWSLPVATSDLGDNWDSSLAQISDYIMGNIHPFFAGVNAQEAASWTYSFWHNKASSFFKSDNSKNVISEIGWPTKGGTNCGSDSVTDCPNGSVAGIDELNTLMEDWVCQALENGTNYFWFEMFDEPWKIAFDEPGKEWEDQWGLMDVNRNLKDGVKIPDCGGKTV